MRLYSSHTNFAPIENKFVLPVGQKTVQRDERNLRVRIQPSKEKAYILLVDEDAK